MDIQNSNDVFTVVHVTIGKSKDKKSKVKIETSTKGLVYRTEVYKSGFLVDAKEIACQDIATNENSSELFRERYLSTHNKFEDLYFAEVVFLQVLATNGEYAKGEGECLVKTSVYENSIKTEVIVNSNEVDQKVEQVDSDIVSNSELFKSKYTQLHDSMVSEYVYIPKFPANTFLNGILKKLPFYSTNPMYSLYVLIVIVALILWIISFIVCGKSLSKITKSIAGKEAAMMVKDFQKSTCRKRKSNIKKPEEILDDKDVEDLYGTKYVVLPEQVRFTHSDQIKSIYIKNNLLGDIIVRVREKVIKDFVNPLATPDMIVNILSKTTFQIKGGDIGYFEFKIEKEYLENTNLEKGFKGNIVFDIINVREKNSEPIAVEFLYLIGEDDL